MRDKIAVLFLHSQDEFNADSQIHAHIMQYLDRESFEVHVACSRSDGTGEPPSLTAMRAIPDVIVRPTQFVPGFQHRRRETVLRGLRAGAAWPVDLVALARYVRRHRIRIIHSTDRPRDTLYAVALAKATGARSIAHVHIGWSKHYSRLAVWGVRNADAVFGISRFVTETVVASGTPRDRIHTILNGIDPSGWDPGADGGSVRRELGIPPGAPVLASVSRLFGHKGQRELVKSFAKVRAHLPDARLLIVGGDAVLIHGGSFTAELTVLARDLGVSDGVVFTGRRSDVAAIMAACDVFAMPSFEEPFGLVFLEAMAMNRPVVSLDNGGTPEVVEHGRSGLLSPANDIDQLAENILTLLQNPDLRVEMGAYGRSRVLGYFNAQRMARDAAAAYRSVLRS